MLGTEIYGPLPLFYTSQLEGPTHYYAVGTLVSISLTQPNFKFVIIIVSFSCAEY